MLLLLLLAVGKVKSQRQTEWASNLIRSQLQTCKAKAVYRNVGDDNDDNKGDGYLTPSFEEKEKREKTN